jgi:hypothetical protein
VVEQLTAGQAAQVQHRRVGGWRAVGVVMPLDRMPSISLGIIVPAGAVYDRHHHWRTDTGEPRASVGFDAGGHSHAHLQGSPAALRELAAALLDAAGRADPAAVPAPVAEGVAS